MAELKRCPFCGGEAGLLCGDYKSQQKSQEVWIVGCNTGGCLGRIFPVKVRYESREEAAEAWNRRVGAEQ